MAALASSALPPAWLPAPLRPIYRAVTLWIEADGLRMSAAMAFYGILSMAPLLVIVVAVLGWWLDRSVVEGRLVAQIAALVGPRGAELVRTALASAQAPTQGVAASLLALVLLVVGATGVLAELQAAFERLWHVGGPKAPAQPWWHGVSLRLRGLAYILAFGFLLLVSLLVSAVLGVVVGWAGQHLPLAQVVFVLNEAMAFVFCAVLFLALMRMSTGPKPSLRFLAFGALVGAALFTLGKHVLAAYLSTAAVVSAYGAAGSLVVMLMWLYFSCALLLFAASCARGFSEAARGGAQ